MVFYWQWKKIKTGQNVEARWSKCEKNKPNIPGRKEDTSKCSRNTRHHEISRIQFLVICSHFSQIKWFPNISHFHLLFGTLRDDPFQGHLYGRFVVSFSDARCKVTTEDLRTSASHESAMQTKIGGWGERYTCEFIFITGKKSAKSAVCRVGYHQFRVANTYDRLLSHLPSTPAASAKVLERASFPGIAIYRITTVAFLHLGAFFDFTLSNQFYPNLIVS